MTRKKKRVCVILCWNGYNICLQFEITDDEIEELHLGFIDWVQEYEE